MFQLTRGAVRAALLALIFAAAPAPMPASAHAIITASEPSDRSTLQVAPARVVLDFNARTEGKLTRVKLLRTDVTPNEEIAVDMDASASRPERVVVPLPALAPGAYMLQYKVLAEDGHASQGAVRFTVLPRN
ncbi:MAG: copper resistance CopC family protein [Gammaproteobacteria bacterium]